MALCNLIGHRRCHDIIDTVPPLALCVNVFCCNFSAYIRFFVNVLIEMNVVCVCVFGFNVAFNNFSVISRRCLVATGSSLLTFIVLPH